MIYIIQQSVAWNSRMFFFLTCGKNFYTPSKILSSFSYPIKKVEKISYPTQTSSASVCAILYNRSLIWAAIPLFVVMHQSVPNANTPPPPPATPAFCTYFQPGSRDLYHLNCLGVARGSHGSRTYYLLS